MTDVTQATQRIHSSVDRLSGSAHRAVDRVAERAAPAVDEVRRTAEHYGTVVGEKLDEFSQVQEAWVETLRDNVRERPLAVMAMAVVAGLLIGRLTRW